MSPAISVIMPNHNGSQFISDAIRSVLMQTFDDLELVIVDDGSEDSSVEVSKGCQDQDERIRLVTLGTNRGVSAARNTGLKESSSKLVTFLDSDDLMAKERLERIVGAGSQKIDSSVIYSDVIPINTDERVVESRPSENLSRPSGMILGPLITGSFRFVAGTIAAPKALLTEVGSYDEHFTWGEDFELCLRLAKRYPFRFDQISTYGHRVHPASKTSVITKQDRWAQQAKILEMHMNDSMPRLNASERRRLYNYLFSCYVASDQLRKIPRVGVSNVPAFLSMVGLPVRALVR